MPTRDLPFEHTFADALPGLYVEHAPEGFPAPELVEKNRPLLEALGLSDLTDEEAAGIFSGTVIPKGARPVAQAYAGHQFGHLSPQLGDGRAVLLGEIVDDKGRRFDVHLKGAGRTVFSRGGDGRATLGPALRELIISEAMAALGIPTSRVLAVVKTGESVRREGMLPGAVLARVASSHLRVGTLEFLAIRGKADTLAALVRYAAERHYPEAAQSDNVAIALLHEVAKAQAKLIAKWMHVGFIHGVMNTDNVALSGETIDFGPCAFVDAYAHDTVFSSIDRDGRYAFGNQPAIGLWNMLRMTEAVLPLVATTQADADELGESIKATFRSTFNAAYLDGLRAKVGLQDEAPDDMELLSELFEWMELGGRDYTATFRDLAKSLRTGAEKDGSVGDGDERFAKWTARWHQRLGGERFDDVADRMDAVNPVYIPRNHLVEEALAAAHRGDMGPFRTLMEVLREPFREREGLERYTEGPPADFGPYKTFCGT